MEKVNLKVYAINEFGFGNYSYLVDTPDVGTMYFTDKKTAREFIEFYRTYKNKKCTEIN